MQIENFVIKLNKSTEIIAHIWLFYTLINSKVLFVTCEILKWMTLMIIGWLEGAIFSVSHDNRSIARQKVYFSSVYSA